jgi:hypothetical protein
VLSVIQFQQLVYDLCRFVLELYKKPSVTHQQVQCVVETTEELISSTVTAIDNDVFRFIQSLPAEVLQEDAINKHLQHLYSTIRTTKKLFGGAIL